MSAARHYLNRLQAVMACVRACGGLYEGVATIAGRVVRKKPRAVACMTGQPLSVYFGSPGRTRTCDQPVTRAPVFRLGLDYLFTRLNEGRVSGASKALLDRLLSL